MWWEYQPNIVPRLVRDISSDVGTFKLAAYWNNMLHMSAQCYEHRFKYCTNAKTCFNVHFRPILAKRPVLLVLSRRYTINAGVHNSLNRGPSETHSENKTSFHRATYRQKLDADTTSFQGLIC